MKNRKEVAIEVIVLLFVLLFVYAATTKLLDYTKFRIQIGQSPMLTAFAGWIAWIIPALEIVVAIMLLVNRFRLIALYTSFSLMIMFTTYIIAILRFSEFIPCSCGGVLQNMTWTQHLVFNIAFALLAFTGIILYHNLTCFSRQSPAV